MLTSFSVFYPLCSWSNLNFPVTVQGEALFLKISKCFLQLLATYKSVLEQRSDRNAQTEVCVLSKGASCFEAQFLSSRRWCCPKADMSLYFRPACDFVVRKREIRIKSITLASSSLCQPSRCVVCMCLSQCSRH